MKQLDQYEQIAEKICNFIRTKISETNSSGVVFGLSGGIDSTVVAFLCTRALGKEKCLALILPHDDITPESETIDAIEVAKKLGINYKICNIAPILKQFKSETALDSDKLATGNLLARIRASAIYYHANAMNYLVVGTDDKSEYLIGYFTKYGDGASDILPIKNLYKTEVQRLGSHLKIPNKIVKKIPGPHLWKDHNSQTELGIEYATIDIILESYFDKNMNVDSIITDFGLSHQTVNKIIDLYKNSQHKRELQPSCNI